MSRRGQRVQDAPGYLLHATAWRETSLLVQVFSRGHGTVALVAKGAKRPYSVLRPVLSAFQPLQLSWSGAGEVKTLIRAECAGVRPLGGRALMSAWYMNELLLRLLPREDPHPALYDAYDAALRQLAGGTAPTPAADAMDVPGTGAGLAGAAQGMAGDPGTSFGPPVRGGVAAALRRFEWILLNETGYGDGEDMPDFSSAQTEAALRAALRERLDELLGRPLMTRKVLMALQRV